MQILQCTGKLRKEMGLKKGDLTNLISEVVLLGAWHANLIYANRRKAVLFTNDKTLFNFVVINLKRAEIKNLATLFRENLAQVLSFENFSAKEIEEVLKEYETIQYAKTRDKSVLGSMNDYAYQYKYYIRNGEFLPDIIHKLNQMPMGALHYHEPIALLREMLK